MGEHDHWWNYMHAQIAGKRPNETVVVRYCECGLRQMAVAKDWRQATGAYALDEHYDEVSR